ncbi:MAG: hypothetical protein DRJ07_20645 [Bacteroidetes bacterium]|nr:MAG: hypothetical protein DRJ07_20645 [Bacteroidota bacterium]
MIKAITFDLWDTIFIDDSDEPKRKAAGRLSKKEERRQLVFEFAKKHKDVSYEMVNAINNTVDASFNKVWHEQFVTWEIGERLVLTFKGLGIELPSDEMAKITKSHEEMELEFRPDFIDGIGEVLEELSKNYKIGVISDAIVSPGSVLRELLKGEGLLHYFEHFVFSDEIGNSKPMPIVFESAFKKFSVEPHELVHIGDREHNDILGPLAVGAHALLCTAAIDRDSENTKADGVFSNYKELPLLIKTIK